MVRWGWKIPTFWILGAVCMLFGSIIASSVATYQSANAAIMALMALMLFLLGGMFWISVSAVVKSKS